MTRLVGRLEKPVQFRNFSFSLVPLSYIQLPVDKSFFLLEYGLYFVSLFFRPQRLSVDTTTLWSKHLTFSVQVDYHLP